MPLVRARRRRDAGKVVRATEPCDSQREMGDPDTERGRAPALSVIRRYRDQRAPLLRRVSPACGVPVSVPQWVKPGPAGIDLALASDGDPGAVPVPQAGRGLMG